MYITRREHTDFRRTPGSDATARTSFLALPSRRKSTVESTSTMGRNPRRSRFPTANTLDKVSTQRFINTDDENCTVVYGEHEKALHESLPRHRVKRLK